MAFHQAGVSSTLGRPDWLYLLLFSTFSFSLCTLRSQPRLFWGDELLGHRLLSAPTVAAMLRGWWQGADGGGLFYYLFARLWVDCFGLGELSLRLFSTAGMCTALGLTWAAARRFFSVAVVAASSAIVYFTPAVMLWQQLNGRFYGLFLAAAAWASLLFLLAAEQMPTRRGLFCHGMAHALLIGSHILGVIYSFSLIAATVALDRRKCRVRPKLYLAELSGWLLVPISYHAIRQSASIATAGFWTRAPGFRDYLLGFFIFGKLTVLVFAALSVVTAAVCFLHPRPPKNSSISLTPALSLLGSLTLAETILFLKSQVGTSIYADRYLLPMSIGTVFLFAFLLRALFEQASRHWPGLALGLQLVPHFLVLCCCGYALSRRTNYQLYPSRGYPERLLQSVPAGATVISNSLVFELLRTYNSSHRFVTPFNWKYGPRTDDHNDYSDQRLMQNWKRAGYDEANILPCKEAFSASPFFYVLIDPPQTTWFAEHIVSNPGYRTKNLAASTEWQPLTLWSVHRLTPMSPPC